MNRTTRLLATLIAVVALALTGVGLYAAASDSNPAGYSDASLQLHGRPPTSMLADVVITTHQQRNITGTLAVDLTNDQAELSVAIPAIFSTDTYSAVVSGSKVYLGVPTLASLLSTNWISIPSDTPTSAVLRQLLDAVYRDGKLVTHDFASGLPTPTVTHGGPYTLYRYTDVLPLNPQDQALAGSILKLPSSYRVTVTLRTAGQGQLADASVAISAGPEYLGISMHVVSYDQAVSITVPPANQVKPLSTSMIKKAFNGTGSNPFEKLLEGSVSSSSSSARQCVTLTGPNGTTKTVCSSTKA